MDRKIQKEYIDYGFGFPVHLLDVPMAKIRGEWTLDINFNRYETVVLLALANKEGRLSGNEIHFIRQHFKMTLEKFGHRFAVSHPAVKKWEATENRPNEMTWTTEKDIRLFILEQLEQKATDILETYRKLEEQAPSKISPMRIKAKKLSA